MEIELRTTDEVANPFGYARQLVQSKDGNRRTAFFFPHDTETAPWWQGENARLGSLAAAARLGRRHFKDDPAFHDKLQAYASNQLNWILGLQPVRHLHAARHRPQQSALHVFQFLRIHQRPRRHLQWHHGGLQQSARHRFQPLLSVTGKDEDWRWGEQWLPHAAWYLYAISLNH